MIVRSFELRPGLWKAILDSAIVRSFELSHVLLPLFFQKVLPTILACFWAISSVQVLAVISHEYISSISNTRSFTNVRRHLPSL